MKEDFKGTRFFEFLTDEEGAEFARVSELVTFAAAEDIIEEGDEPRSMYVLLSGTVEIRKRLSDGGSRTLAEIRAGEGQTIVGERGLLGRTAASATVRSKSRVEAVRIPREAFYDMISESRPAAFKLAYRISRLLARRLARLDDEIIKAIREMEHKGDTDLDVFRDRLITEWTV